MQVRVLRVQRPTGGAGSGARYPVGYRAPISMRTTWCSTPRRTSSSGRDRYRAAPRSPRGSARWIRGKLQWSRLTGRTSIRVRATGMSGVLVIQPFWMNDSDGRAAPVDPVAPPRRVLYLPDPILCEECVMYLACTARAPGGGEDVDGERPARMGNVLRGILRSFRVGRWTGADESGETRPGRRAAGTCLELRGRLRRQRRRGPPARRRGFDDDHPIAARTGAGRRKQQADDGRKRSPTSNNRGVEVVQVIG